MKVGTEISIISESSSSVISINLNKLNQVKFVNLQLVSNFQMSSIFSNLNVSVNSLSLFRLRYFNFRRNVPNRAFVFSFFIIDSYV